MIEWKEGSTRAASEQYPSNFPKWSGTALLLAASCLFSLHYHSFPCASTTTARLLLQTTQKSWSKWVFSQISSLQTSTNTCDGTGKASGHLQPNLRREQPRVTSQLLRLLFSFAPWGKRSNSFFVHQDSFLLREQLVPTITRKHC